MAKAKSSAKSAQNSQFTSRLLTALGPVDQDAIDQATVRVESMDDFEKRFYIRTGAIPFDLLTGGYGLPVGTLFHLWCENGIGKTTFLMSAMRSMISYSQKNVWWFPFEPSNKLALDMRMIGPQKLFSETQFRYFDRMHYYSDLERGLKNFIRSNADVAVIDSLTSTTYSPETMAEDGSFEKHRVGTKSRIEGLFLEQAHAWCRDAGKTILYITQARNKIATKPWQKSGLDAAGGEGSKFYSEIRASMRGAKKIMSQQVGADGAQRHVGTQAWLFAEKDRHAAPLVKIPVTILFGAGHSSLASMKEFLLWDQSLLTGGGAGWYTSYLGGVEKKVQGTGALNSILRETQNQTQILDLFYSQRGKDYYNYLHEQSTFSEE